MRETGYPSTSGRPDEFPVFFRDGNRVRRCLWKGKTWADLTEAYCDVFCIDDATHLRKHHFCLRHREFKIVYENWSLDDLYPGALVEVRTPDSLARAKNDNEQLLTWEAQRAKRTLRAPAAFQPIFDTRNFVVDYMARKYGKRKLQVHPFRYWRRKIWTFFDDSNSSIAAYVWAVFIIVVIVFSTVTFCVETLPYYAQSSNNRSSPFSIIEIVNVSIFTFEFLMRLITVPSQRQFWTNVLNWVDFIAIAPFYIELVVDATTSGHTPTLQVFRILRLVRVFRLFRMSRAVTEIFARTMQLSAKPLYMLVFFTCLGVVFFSSLLYYAERGVYDEELGIWKRVAYYQCPVWMERKAPDSFTAGDTIPSGLDDMDCEFLRLGSTPQSAEFICPYRFPKNSQCRKVYEVSPFESIPATFWWCIVTITTVGYGDITPTQWYGKALSMIAMLCGILVIALPITVIGANFSSVYDEYLEKEVSAEQQGGDGNGSIKGGDTEALGRYASEETSRSQLVKQVSGPMA